MARLHYPLRFGLEVAAVVVLGWWGATFDAPLAVRAAAAAAIPAAAAGAWAVFRVPNDPGPAAVAVPGVARLALEGGLFAATAAALGVRTGVVPAALFVALVLVDYALSWRRVAWLVGR